MSFLKFLTDEKRHAKGPEKIHNPEFNKNIKTYSLNDGIKNGIFKLLPIFGINATNETPPIKNPTVVPIKEIKNASFNINVKRFFFVIPSILNIVNSFFLSLSIDE